MIRDILESVYREGITQGLHHERPRREHRPHRGGLEVSAKVAHPDFKILSLDAWWMMVGEVHRPPRTSSRSGTGSGHGGEGETSICLELFPELCDMKRAAGVVPNLPPYVDVKWRFSELTNTGASGDPTKATPEKGKKMRQVLVDTVAKILCDLDATDWDYRSEKIK